MRSVGEKALAVKGGVHTQSGAEESDEGEKLNHFGGGDDASEHRCRVLGLSEGGKSAMLLELWHGNMMNEENPPALYEIINRSTFHLSHLFYLA